jgi:hypothetical protein
MDEWRRVHAQLIASKVIGKSVIETADRWEFRA